MDGVSPPSLKAEHSSMRLAFPPTAARTDSKESTQTSNIFTEFQLKSN